MPSVIEDYGKPRRDRPPPSGAPRDAPRPPIGHPTPGESPFGSGAQLPNSAWHRLHPGAAPARRTLDAGEDDGRRRDAPDAHPSSRRR
jgi:hypothetical protein